MTDHTPHRLRLSDLSGRAETPVDLVPDADARAAIAAELDLIGLRKLRLSGRLVPEGRRDWRLEAQLGATVVQPCGVTLEPVTTRIDEPVTRRYLADWSDPEGDEIEMPEDDSAEPLPAVLDLRTVLIEALSLALPAFPRAPDAATGAATFTEPGTEPMTDEEVRPFAGLKALRDKLTGEDD